MNNWKQKLSLQLNLNLQLKKNISRSRWFTFFFEYLSKYKHKFRICLLPQNQGSRMELILRKNPNPAIWRYCPFNRAHIWSELSMMSASKIFLFFIIILLAFLSIYFFLLNYLFLCKYPCHSFLLLSFKINLLLPLFIIFSHILSFIRTVFSL
jgi:hypothetical protein